MHKECWMQAGCRHPGAAGGSPTVVRVVAGRVLLEVLLQVCQRVHIVVPCSTQQQTVSSRAGVLQRPGPRASRSNAAAGS